jgi:WD40 repeat protein
LFFPTSLNKIKQGQQLVSQNYENRKGRRTKSSMASCAFCKIECSEQPLDLSFHPSIPGVLAAGLVDGTVEVHDFNDYLQEKLVAKAFTDDEGDDELDTIVSSTMLHTQLLPAKQDAREAAQACCRAVEFSLDGSTLYSGGSAGDLVGLDANIVSTFSPQGKKAIKWRINEASCRKSAGIQIIREFDRGSRFLLATGDEAGCVRIWDSRLMGYSGEAAPVHSWKLHEDYISGLELSADGHTLLASSADSTLSVYDLRMTSQGPDKGTRRSDDQEDELLSVLIMKNGRKVICGSGEGVLSVFSWGTWGDVSDRFPGHPASVDALLKIDEDTLLTGSSDGLIRVVQIHPDKLLGVIGDHEGFPIEKLAYNSDQNFIGSVTHDNLVRIWDARMLQEEFDGASDDGEANEMNVDATAMAVAQSKEAEVDSEDGWENMDEDSDDEDVEDAEVDSDDSGEDEDRARKKAPGKNDKRKERLKTDNDKFFEDL